MGTEKAITDYIAECPPFCFAPEDQVAAAVASMKEHKSDCVLVCEGDIVRGVFTQRDFLRRVALAGQADAKLGDVMTKNPDVLREHDSIMTALRRMAVGNYRNIPIVGENGQAIANLSIWEVMRHLGDRFAGDLSHLGEMSIEALYQRPAVEVESSMGLLSVLTLMMQRACGAIRVNKDERLVGIFAEQDLMHRVDYSKAGWDSISVANVMTKNPMCIQRDTTIAAALSTMNEHSFRHLPVVDDPSAETTWIVSVRDILGFVVSRLPE